MSLLTAMESECLNCVFKITQPTDNCRFYYNTFSKALFASNMPILQGNKSAHLHFLAGVTFTHLGLSLASLHMCILIFTAVGMPKWVNSYRWLNVCTIKGLLKQIILTLNVKNARESSSMTRQRYRRNLQQITSLAYNCCVRHLSPNQCSSWISRGKLRPKFGLGSMSSLWTRGPLRNSFHCLFSPVDYATSDPPRSHQTSHWNSRPSFTKKCKYTLNFEHRNRLTDSQVASGR